MTRCFLGTRTTRQFVDGLSRGVYSNVVSVVATSDCLYIKEIGEAVADLGLEGSVHISTFDDITDSMRPEALGEEEARAIYDFLAMNDSDDARFLFVCDGSVSRSSAMLCAWMRLCGEDDLPVWIDAMDYAPNVLVYSRILAAGGVRLSEANVWERELLKRLAFAREIAGRGVHAMHLLDVPWSQIASGEKRCELRRLDAKRKRVSAGDLVVFSRLGHPDDIVAADVLKCRTAACFGDLMRDGEVVAASGFRSAEEAVAALRGIYGDDPCPAVAIFLDTSCWARGQSDSTV